MKEIKPNQVYTTQEAQDFLKISNSTIKRHLKSGIIQANKVGGRYRILGAELLNLVSPQAEKGATIVYRDLKEKVGQTIKNW
ncbi:helix-turn-helix domain-containing protein [Candidatus Parcubacteria bacterium]|nr:helix-turn-helix domain-containing protein [Candidatus Parcubacteria bacterium]